jgi:hypothetical protein
MQPGSHALHRGRCASHWPRVRIVGLSMLAVAVAAGAVYVRSLGFGFFNDDPTGHFRWMEGVSPLQLFTSSAGYGFYRPLTFAIWKLLLALFGGYSRPGFHALGLALHAANAALVWLLACRLSGRPIYAWVTALTFACFPFSYEAVAYVAAVFHPLVAFWALLTLLLYQQAREAGEPGYLAAAHLTSIFGLFTHENGTLIPLLVLAWEWVSQPRRCVREYARQPARWFLVAPVVFVCLWQSVAKSNANSLQPVAHVLYNALPFLQLSAFPLFPLLRVSAEQPWLLAGLAAATVALMYGVAHASRSRRLYLFAVVWLFLSALPSALLLTPAYLYGSPRLYYFASIGAALLWGLPVLALQRLLVGSRVLRCTARVAQALVALGIMLPSLLFIRCQLDFFDLATQIVRQMAQRVAEAPLGREVLFVNVPFYFSSCPRYPSGCTKLYPIAPTGAVVVPPYADVRDFVRVNGGPDQPVQAVVFKGYDPGWNTHGRSIDLDGLRSSVETAQVYVFDLMRLSWLDLSSVWELHTLPAPSTLATFGGIVSLEDVHVASDDDHLVVTLRWYAHQASSRPLTVFVHLYDASGSIVAQHDGQPAGGHVRARFWQAGDRIHDAHIVAPTEHMPAGRYQLRIGVYDSNTGVRLPGRAPDGSALADDAYSAGEVNWP